MLYFITGVLVFVWILIAAVMMIAEKPEEMDQEEFDAIMGVNRNKED